MLDALDGPKGFMFESTIRYNVLLDEIVDLCRGRSCASGSILGGPFVLRLHQDCGGIMDCTEIVCSE